MFSLLHRRVVAPIASLLTQGVAPGQIAWAVAIGAGVGVFPVPGTTTVLCTLAALAFRLNLVAVHAVHYAVTPLQLLLVIPFVRVGEHLVGVPPERLSLQEGLLLIERDVGNALVVLAGAVAHSVAGWLAVGPLSIGIVYLASAWLIERTHAMWTKPPSKHTPHSAGPG